MPATPGGGGAAAGWLGNLWVIAAAPIPWGPFSNPTKRPWAPAC